MWTALAALHSSRHLQGIRDAQKHVAHTRHNMQARANPDAPGQHHATWPTATNSRHVHCSKPQGGDISLLTVQNTEQTPRSSSVKTDKKVGNCPKRTRPCIHCLSAVLKGIIVSPVPHLYHMKAWCYDGEDAPSSAACSVTSAAVTSRLASSTAPGGSGSISAPASSSVHACSSTSSSSASPVSSSAARQGTQIEHVGAFLSWQTCCCGEQAASAHAANALTSALL